LNKLATAAAAAFISTKKEEMDHHMHLHAGKCEGKKKATFLLLKALVVLKMTAH